MKVKLFLTKRFIGKRREREENHRTNFDKRMLYVVFPNKGTVI